MRLPLELLDKFTLASAYEEERWDPELSDLSTGTRAWLALGLGLQDEGDSTYIETRFDVDGAMPPSWPSTLDYIETHCQGFHGVTSLAAAKGTGKTTLATSCAIEAAAHGWQVVVFLAEDDTNGLRKRLFEYAQYHPDSAAAAVEWLHFFSVPMGVTKESILMDITAATDRESDRPVLVVMDSINTIASLSRGNYLHKLHNLGLWAMISRRISRGAVSFMLVSETNQRNEIKGANLGFWSDQVLTMKRVKGEEGLVEMTLAKARRWGGTGPMGKYIRHYRAGRFLRPDQVPEQMRLMNRPGGLPVAPAEEPDIL